MELFGTVFYASLRMVAVGGFEPNQGQQGLSLSLLPFFAFVHTAIFRLYVELVISPHGPTARLPFNHTVELVVMGSKW